VLNELEPYELMLLVELVVVLDPAKANMATKAMRISTIGTNSKKILGIWIEVF
jgi:hypothetical protein